MMATAFIMKVIRLSCFVPIAELIICWINKQHIHFEGKEGRLEEGWVRCTQTEMTSSPPLLSHIHQLENPGRTHLQPNLDTPRRERAETRPCRRSSTYKAVGAAGTQHVERDAGLCVKVQPPLVVLLGEDEVEGVTGAPLLRRLHQMLELHPLLSALRCPWCLCLFGRRGDDAQDSK